MNIKKMTLTAFFIALSYAGSMLKIFGTVAFDSLAGFLSALILGPVYGAAVGALGNVFTSLLSGMPYGMLSHIVIPVCMALTMFGYGTVYSSLEKKHTGAAKNYIITGITGLILNGPVCLAVSAVFLIPAMGTAFVIALLPMLCIGAAANIILSIIIHSMIHSRIEKLL